MSDTVGPAPEAQEELVLTVDEAAKALRISRGLAFIAVRDGTLPSIRIGRRILIPRGALQTLLGVDTPVDTSS